MADTTKEAEPTANFSGAIGAYYFFTRRYVLVFYAVLAFAFVFAILISLVSIGLTVFNLLAGESFQDELEFTLMVFIFFGLGFQAIMAFASSAYNLWHITFQQADPREEFPATLKRMDLIRTYYGSTRNGVAKLLAFLLPGLLVTLILVVPLFAAVLFFSSFLSFAEVQPNIIRGIFIPDLFLVWLSVFLMNFNYYLGTKSNGKEKEKI